MLKKSDISNNNSVLKWENDVIHNVRRFYVDFTLKGVTNTCKRMRRSLSIGGSAWVYICNGGKLEKAEDFKCIFVVYFVLESKKISPSAWIVV